MESGGSLGSLSFSLFPSVFSPQPSALIILKYLSGKIECKFQTLTEIMLISELKE